jgi:3-oxoacyl-[acyl-carrier protein] reductase
MTAPAGAGTDKLIALLTNGSQFAGPAALLGLKPLNCQVYVHDPSFSDNAKLHAFASAHDGVIPLAGDRLSVASDVMKAEGRLDILIENPSPRGEAHVTDDDDVAALDAWLNDAARELIVEPFKLLNFAARAMRQQSRGAIVLLTSESWEKPQHGSVYYSAMRAAYPCLALGAARDLGPDGIQVNCISPNFLESKEYYPPQIWSQPEKQKELAELVPVGRLQTADELGNLIGFLASGPDPFLTGSTIKVDGGALVSAGV